MVYLAWAVSAWLASLARLRPCLCLRVAGVSASVGAVSLLACTLFRAACACNGSLVGWLMSHHTCARTHAFCTCMCGTMPKHLCECVELPVCTMLCCCRRVMGLCHGAASSCAPVDVRRCGAYVAALCGCVGFCATTCANCHARRQPAGELAASRPIGCTVAEGRPGCSCPATMQQHSTLIITRACVCFVCACKARQA